MTTVQIVQHLQPGGIETLALDLLQNPHASPSFCISLEGDRQTAIARWSRLAPFQDQLIFMGKKRGLQPGLALRLARVLRRLSASVAHTHHVGPLLYGGAAARIAGVRLLHTEHDAWHLENEKRRRLMQALTALYSPVVVADADAVAQQFSARLGRAVDHIILNGVDVAKFSPGDRQEARRRLDLPHGRPVIGFAGRLEHVKGCDLALEALARSEPSVVLAVAGDGAERAALEAQARSLGVADRVLFLGRIDDMRAFFRAIDALCLSSRREGLPIAALEAQACGAPVIAFNVGGVREALCPQSGVLLPAGDVTALAVAFDAASKREETKASARRFVSENASRDAMWSRYAAAAS
ncbi:MAG: glycosyltransferase [Pseudomonadota bacterium]